MILLSPRSKRELSRFLKFSVVGIIGAVVDFGTFNLLTLLLGIWSLAASVVSFIAAVTSNFFWNRYWTYPDSRSKPLSQQAIQFGFVNLIGLLIRTPIFAFSEGLMIRIAARFLNWGFFGNLLNTIFTNDAVLGRNLALALAVTVVMFWNFGINRIWTYADVS
ncbi:MAG: GtrA family protein [Anaerolineales bacterium]|nr:GtrA family protein [Anaerolineales bacterium]